MANDIRKNIKSYEEYDRIMKAMASRAPETDEELEAAHKEWDEEWDQMTEEEREEFREMDRRAQAMARGDFSHIKDPAHRKRLEEIRAQSDREREERNRLQAEQKNSKSKKRTKTKEVHP